MTFRNKLLISWAIWAIVFAAGIAMVAIIGPSSSTDFSAEEVKQIISRLPTEEQFAEWNRQSQQAMIDSQQALVTSIEKLCKALDEVARLSGDSDTRNCWRKLADERQKLSPLPRP